MKPKSLRDEFAIAALTGIMANPDCAFEDDWEFADFAYDLADAMMKRREK